MKDILLHAKVKKEFLQNAANIIKKGEECK
jgi:hypothetical protein